jgi:hypothetical protein
MKIRGNNTSITKHFIIRVNQRMSMNITTFIEMFNTQEIHSNIIFSGKYKASDKKIKHILIKYGNEYYIIIQKGKSFTTLLSRDIYQKQSWGLNLSPFIHKMNKAINNKKANESVELLIEDIPIIDTPVAIDIINKSKIDSNIKYHLANSILSISKFDTRYPNGQIQNGALIELLSLTPNRAYLAYIPSILNRFNKDRKSILLITKEIISLLNISESDSQIILNNIKHRKKLI